MNVIGIFGILKNISIHGTVINCRKSYKLENSYKYEEMLPQKEYA